MAKARSRVSRAVSILQELMDDAEMVVAVEELRAWLHSFDPDSLVQLDYGGLTRAIPFEDLVADHSAAEVWEALGRLEAGRSGPFQRAVPQVERALVGAAGTGIQQLSSPHLLLKLWRSVADSPTRRGGK
jgi:hypothetical protein